GGGAEGREPTEEDPAGGRPRAPPSPLAPQTHPECRDVLWGFHLLPPIPADIFTEPDNVAPDGLANLGPLRRLAGIWQADKGVDINPKAQGPERRVFQEHIRMDPIDPQTNGPQLLYGLRYHIHINTPEE